MKSVDLRCLCGSAITFRDDAESLINPDASPDDKGRIFLVEVRSDEWQAKHQSCIDARIIEITSPPKAQKKKKSR